VSGASTTASASASGSGGSGGSGGASTGAAITPLGAGQRRLLTGCAMTAVLMQIIDSTISMTALPYMQGSLSATMDQITWVLSSYIIVSAIMTAPVGWVANRFGRKNLFVFSMIGFTATSVLCGMAQTLEQMVAFRIIQGTFGAALAPLAQATMLDIYPFEQRAQAMAIFGLGIMVGPIMGPTLGGYLTDWFHWRWVFYVNVPFGILATFGLLFFMPRSPVRPELKFDFIGFGVLALAIGAFQLMLDRGQSEDWFTSAEIVVCAVLAALGFYLFLVHMFTSDRPLIPRGVFRDRNFVAAMTMMFCTGSIMMASSALLSPFLQKLSGYPPSEAGLLLAPRGMGTMVAMVLAARLGGRYVDQRKLMAFGLIGLGLTLHSMTGWTPEMPSSLITTTLVIQGFCMGFIFNPMTVVAFATLPPQFRADAAALQNLARNSGAAIGIAVTSFMLTRNTQTAHADMAANITPFPRLTPMGDLAHRLLDPGTTRGAGLLDAMITREAQIVAFANDYQILSVMVLPPLLVLFIMRRPPRAAPALAAARPAAAAPAAAVLPVVPAAVPGRAISAAE
jgi:MFS transporter, DHA2 family, multidrug resistance protein